MDEVVSVHIVDVGFGQAVRLLRRKPDTTSIDGLRHANIAAAMPLASGPLALVTPRRVALFTFWDDLASARRFGETHPLAAKLAGGWRAILEPLPAHGSWPGLADGIPRARRTDYDGPSVVLTLGRMRMPRALSFIRTSAGAERDAKNASAMTWGTVMARPPFVATCSLWPSVDALSSYAYGAEDAPHPVAIAAERKKPFHHQSAFVRCRPLEMEGTLTGRNPLTDEALPAFATSSR